MICEKTPGRKFCAERIPALAVGNEIEHSASSRLPRNRFLNYLLVYLFLRHQSRSHSFFCSDANTHTLLGMLTNRRKTLACLQQGEGLSHELSWKPACLTFGPFLRLRKQIGTFGLHSPSSTCFYDRRGRSN